MQLAAERAWLYGCCKNPLSTEQHEETAAMEDPGSKNTSATCRKGFAAITTSTFFPNTQFTDNENLPSLLESFLQFTKAYPKYSETSRVDRIRAQEYYHLSLSNRVCLDYIGIGLFSYSQAQSPVQIPDYASTSSPPQILSDSPFFSLSSKSVDLRSHLVDGGGQESSLDSTMKNRIMDFLNISQNDYCAVFTANKSSAFKLVADSYPFQTSKKLLTVYDYDSEALQTMSSTSEKRGAEIMSAEFKWPRLRVQSADLRKMVTRKNKKKKNYRGLFVIPLQSRMTGGSYSYQWMSLAQENGWHVMLDCCALGPKDMDSFGLSLFRPDFLVCSFYKVIGENPTGFGCLFVKKSIIQNLEMSKSAAVVSLVPGMAGKQFPSSEESSGSDNPQLDAKQSAAVTECRCLNHIDSLGLMRISNRGRYLINWLVSALMKLQHPNRLDNFPLVRIYGPKVKFDRGPALSFNIYDWKGEKVEPSLVQKLADRNNISLSTGFLQNFWFSDKQEQEKEKFLERKKGEEAEKSKNKNKKPVQGIAVVTIALNFLANFEDVYKLWAFIAQFLDADFVEKERWRYTALDQKTVEV